ncbi:TonB-dependent receptor [Rhizorhabdus argentea]|uniref:TonB-dependent receptor n=1 Tax=Rhizorhabdus argentea TaxID=1387174 RepID=UPI0030EF0971
MALIVAAPATAFAAARSHFDIPAGPLQQSIVAFAAQSGTTIGALGPVDRLRGAAVRGDMPPERALRRLLQGSGLGFERVDTNTFRLFALPVKPAEPKRDAVRQPAPSLAAGEIVVTASKRETRIGDYAGAVSILDPGKGMLARAAARGTEALVDGVASLSSTNLGPGRNKLIIRGIADSSFTGPSQAVVGQYLNDIRLNYNAPDPNLSLYDMARVEVLEGPQGTLYGAGSLGGIVRLVPNAPDLGQWSGSATAAYLATQDGRSGSELSGMVNLPLLGDRVALRLVGYRAIAGGYIDDVGRGLRDVNRSQTKGGRVALRARIGDSWTVDAGGLVQDIYSADGQYAERGLPPYQRSSAIAQPFDNDYRLGYVTLSRRGAGLQFVSATGIVSHDVRERFDATGFPVSVPSAFDQRNKITLISNETRLSHRADDGTGWLLGTSFISNGEKLSRTLGPVGAPMRIAGVHNSLTGGALYGETTFGIVPRVQITVGGRFAFSHLAGELLDLPRNSGDERNRDETSILPLLSVAWRPGNRLTAYARYQEGYRGGGLSVAAAGAGIVSQRFRGDSIATFEAGLRLGDPASDRFSGALGLIYAHWENIQADLVDSRGLPYTANVGHGRTIGFEAKLGWRLAEGLNVEAGLFVNDSDLTTPAPGFSDSRHAELPDVARLGARTALSYTARLSGDIALSLDASYRYFGHSRLGIGNGLDIVQGGYADTSLGARIGSDRIGMSLDATNLLDANGNRFSLGNPFGVMEGRQITPLRPRTIRFAIDGHF